LQVFWKCSKNRQFSSKNWQKNQTVQGGFFGFLRSMISRSKNMVLLVLRTGGKRSMYSTLTYPAVLSLKKRERMAPHWRIVMHVAASSFCCKTSLDAHGTQTWKSFLQQDSVNRLGCLYSFCLLQAGYSQLKSYKRFSWLTHFL